MARIKIGEAHVSGLARDPLLNAWIAFDFIFGIFYLILSRNLFRSIKLWADRKLPYSMMLLSYIFAIACCILNIVQAVQLDNYFPTWQFVVVLIIFDSLPDLFVLFAVTLMLYNRRDKFTKTLSLTSLPLYRYIIDWTFIGIYLVFVITVTALDGFYDAHFPATRYLEHASIVTDDMATAFLCISLAWIIASSIMLHFAMQAQHVRDVVTDRMAFIVAPLLFIRLINVITQIAFVRSDSYQTYDQWKGIRLAHIILANSVYLGVFLVFITLVERPELWNLTFVEGGNPSNNNGNATMGAGGPTLGMENKPEITTMGNVSTLPYGQMWNIPTQHPQSHPTSVTTTA